MTLKNFWAIGTQQFARTSDGSYVSWGANAVISTRSYSEVVENDVLILKDQKFYYQNVEPSNDDIKQLRQSIKDALTQQNVESHHVYFVVYQTDGEKQITASFWAEVV